MFNELDELNRLNSIEEMTNYINNNMEGLEKLNLEQRQQIADTLLDKTMYHIQTKCLNTEFGKAVNAGLDVLLDLAIPNYIAEEVISLKNNLMNYGIKDGLTESFNEALTVGKTAVNILSNNFESISDAKSAIEAGGALDKVSNLLDKGIEVLEKNKTIDSATANVLQKEKDTIMNSIEKNVDKYFEEQISNFEKLEKSIANWKESYNAQDVTSMKKEYNKMVKIMDKLMPLEKTINEFRTIENIQTLIKNNGNNFDFSQEALELSNKLIN